MFCLMMSGLVRSEISSCYKVITQPIPLGSRTIFLTLRRLDLSFWRTWKKSLITFLMGFVLVRPCLLWCVLMILKITCSSQNWRNSNSNVASPPGWPELGRLDPAEHRHLSGTVRGLPAALQGNKTRVLHSHWSRYVQILSSHWLKS